MALAGGAAAAVLLATATPALSAAPASAPGADTNVRVTADNGAHGPYLSADQLAGGSYTDAVLQRCGLDRRMQK